MNETSSPSLLGAYAEVVLPLPVAGLFTYSVPEVMRQQIRVGSRVIVPFGKKKFYTGIVTSLSPVAPREYLVKEITHVLDTAPVVRHPQLRFWEWMAEYYLCSMGDVYKAAVPAGLKLESETVFECNPDYTADDVAMLNEREAMAYAHVQTKGKLSAAEIEKETGFRNVAPLMQRLFLKGAVVVSESLVSRYRPKREACVRMAIPRENPEALREAFEKVKGAPKQQHLLMTMLQLSGFTIPGRANNEVTVAALLDKCALTSTILKAVADKGIIERYMRETSRFGKIDRALDPMPELSEAQQTALTAVHHGFMDKGTVLLHGVTSSGKTEIYAHLIDYVLNKGNQVLLMVPEIALTTQLTSRLYRIFGNRMIVYHSKFTDNERVEIWNRLLNDTGPCLVVGVRSSVFLPFSKLGLVIVDEEHDSSYKQYDPAPRYNGRDAAIMLAYMHGAKTLLGSATPSIETYYKALNGKYGLVSLTERYKGARLPKIVAVDLAKARQKKEMRGSFALETVSAIRQTVAAGNQAIVFHTRRGFAPMAHCTHCQYIPKCKYCDVSLTYHKRANQLVCHYCGATYPLPETCPVCKEPTIEVVGYGTERIEDEVEEQFPGLRTLRMDLDTTRNKNSYETLINTFSEHKADILVGTQMVTKGLDFGDVAVVAVANADALINFPDFRSAERAFNMLSQVSGRAGRREVEGKVLVQTSTPTHPVIEFVQKHDYTGFYEKEIDERQKMLYPPFTRVINIHLKHRDERELENISLLYADRLRQLFGNRVSGPAKPLVGRVQSLYIRQVMLKVELNASMQKVKEILRELHANLHATVPAMRRLILYYDVDPA